MPSLHHPATLYHSFFAITTSYLRLVLLIAAGVDVKTISARLGHALTSTTMNIYVHALQDSDKKAADAVSNLLGKQT